MGKKQVDKKAQKKFDELAVAVTDKDRAATETLVAQVDPDLVPYNANGDSLLGFAVFDNVPLAIIKLLVEAGAKLDFKNGTGETPISYALAHERKDVIEYFASKGAKVKWVPFDKLPQKEKNARLAKVIYDWYDDSCAKRLAKVLEGGADPNAKIEGDTPLHLLARNTDEKKLYALLLDHDADPAIKNGAGDTAFHLVAHFANVAPIKLFAEAGVPLDIRDAKGNTPLHRAASSGYNGGEDAVKALLKLGADPMLRNKAGETAIDIATPDCKSMMLKAVSKPLSKETLQLIAAVAANDANKVRKLLAAKADPCAVDMSSGKSYGNSDLEGVAAIHVAFSRGVEGEVRDVLLAMKLDVNVRSVEGKTPLHYTMQNFTGAERQSLVERLIALGADVNVRDDQGEVPLREVTSIYKLDGELELVDTLLAAGAKKDTKNNGDETVLDSMFETTERFHEVNDKPGFVAVMQKLVDLKFATRQKKEIDAWLKSKGAKYAPKSGGKKAKAQKPAKPHPARAAFTKLTGGKLAKLVGKTTKLQLDGQKHDVALFDWFAFVDEQNADESDNMMQIAEYHVAEDAVDRVTEGKWIPFGIVGMTGSVDSYRETGVDGTLYVDLSKADKKGTDAPVVFATQSYMGLSPAEPLEVGKLAYASLMKTLATR